MKVNYLNPILPGGRGQNTPHPVLPPPYQAETFRL